MVDENENKFEFGLQLLCVPLCLCAFDMHGVVKRISGSSGANTLAQHPNPSPLATSNSQKLHASKWRQIRANIIFLLCAHHHHFRKFAENNHCRQLCSL